MPPAVHLKSTNKTFGNLKALQDIDLKIEQGERILILGPNGAGKSTLLKLVSAQLSPSSGEIKILGFDTREAPREVKKRVGVVGHNSFLYDELTVEENLKFYGGFFDANAEDIEEAIDIVNLGRWKATRAGHLSHGLRKRGDIARALIAKPKVLALDEFFSGLDAEISHLLIEYLRRYREGTILITSHTAEIAEKVCNRKVYLYEGSLMKDVSI